MDFETEEKPIATDSFKFNKFDSSDFSSKLVTIHTSLDDLEFKSISPPSETFDKDLQFEGARLLNTSEYNELKHSTTSFNKWFSQSSLLADLVDEDLDINRSDSGPNNDGLDRVVLAKEDDSDYEFDFLFYKSDDGNIVNNPVLTFLLNNFFKAEADKPLNLRDDLVGEFSVFKENFVSLVERNTNELKMKKVLLSVAFNHYGCSTVNKYMTLQEYLNMLNVHKVFTNDASSKLVFESMDRKHKSMVTRNEFVSGMLSCSPEAKHNPKTVFGKLRLQHIFRAYDYQRLGYLDKESLDLMQTHLEQVVGDRLSYDQKLNEKLLIMFNGKLSYDSFFYCVENNLLKNTNLLFRSNYDLSDVLKRCLLSSVENVVQNEKSPYENTLNRQVNKEDNSGSFGRQSELFHHSNTERNNYQENMNWLDSNRSNNVSATAKSSLWSHTPRVYSEFTHNRSPSNDQFFGLNYENKWTRSSDTSPNRGYESPIDRLSKMYNDHTFEDELVEEYKQSALVGFASHESGMSPVLSHQQGQSSEVRSDNLHEKYKMSEESAKKELSSLELPKSSFLNALERKTPYQPSEEATPSRFDKIDEFLREYEENYKSPDRSPKPNLPTVFTDINSFQEPLEDDAQVMSQFKHHNEVFKSFDTVDDLLSEKAKLDNLLMDKLAVSDYCFKKEDGLRPGYIENKQQNGLGSASKKEDSLVDSKSTTKNNTVQFEIRCPDELALGSLTDHLSRKYTHKFVVIKGHLIDCTVAKTLFKNFLAHSLGESVDHSSLKLCTYSDMLQLCDSVCSILKKEDSLLQLNGHFKVFGSLNGDLSCLLDHFNAYGWPMMRNTWYSEGPVDAESLRNWDDFDYCYVFMGGFVSESSCCSLEFVLLLFAMKVLFPYHVHFLRSSKDERNAANNAGFYHQIYLKLSENYSALRLENNETLLLQCAKELFHRVNDVFEFMSVGAVLNQEVLCVDKLTKKFSYKKLKGLPKPLNLSTCANEQVYDLLFNEKYFTFPPCLCASSGCDEHNPQQTGKRDFGAGTVKGVQSDFNSNNGVMHDFKMDNKLVSEKDGMINDNFAAPSHSSPDKFTGENSASKDAVWNTGDADAFRLVICCSDELDSGFKYLLNNKLLLLSTNFIRKRGEKQSSSLVVANNKVTLRSLKLD